ncbi:MAG: acetyl-CoA carboxylase biotin carboxyl carrier protein subunit [Lentisphaerae bacterium]|jgi:glutaconyl-CoA/methylmalonyl-CoA decarboxylase subunit gamma|nr:acetyl-CoA carboxylase biotin carboxyl carrier protein subunit [Lentisphaerota bacterium]MBT4815554.1 acetyl-CoA carboxylase biotin carboxyl carrier protein subunit [Lentisphaerota bacterium]MBT5613213.1 acetyl-CoA carboxylase biotin carboxyl carrier protein subunit [Lentisphaerota bacterium]MBT7062124.1 acetyl-CoA carboxylase biotin carboxyl carrier protein subunit [Lentisphaerota bacterium]MBT7847636.1 acetyl-CoA carboxylase biotin carboxyl carrier protein subunit [Lentisphaerota bacterium
MAVYSVQIHGATYDVEIHDLHDGRLSVRLGDKAGTVSARRLLDYARTHPDDDVPETVAGPDVHPQEVAAASQASALAVYAPMPGVVSALSKGPGQHVAEGETVLVLEAMKMKNDVAAPCAGTLAELRVQTGDTVQLGDTLAVVTPASAPSVDGG